MSPILTGAFLFIVSFFVLRQASKSALIELYPYRPPLFPGRSSLRREARQTRKRALVMMFCRLLPTRSNRSIERSAGRRKCVKLPTNSAVDPKKLDHTSGGSHK